MHVSPIAAIHRAVAFPSNPARFRACACTLRLYIHIYAYAALDDPLWCRPGGLDLDTERAARAAYLLVHALAARAKARKWTGGLPAQAAEMLQVRGTAACREMAGSSTAHTQYSACSCLWTMSPCCLLEDAHTDPLQYGPVAGRAAALRLPTCTCLHCTCLPAPACTCLPAGAGGPRKRQAPAGKPGGIPGHGEGGCASRAAQCGARLCMYSAWPPGGTACPCCCFIDLIVFYPTSTACAPPAINPLTCF